MQITCVLDARAELGEGTLWDPEAQVLWWIDIWSRLIHRYDPATGEDRTWEAPEYLGCLGLRARGGLVALAWPPASTSSTPTPASFTPIVDPEADLPLTRFNDGKPDRQGRFWSGTMFEAPGQPVAVHRLALAPRPRPQRAPDDRGRRLLQRPRLEPGQPHHVLRRQPRPAGLAYDFDPATGAIENRRTFVDLTGTGGIADGATVDADGCYWVTVPVTGRVDRYDPDGRLMQTVSLPTDLPTCCEFGGPDLDILYVTTAVLRRPAAHFAGQQNPGGLFAVDAGVRGLPLPPFAG